MLRASCRRSIPLQSLPRHAIILSRPFLTTKCVNDSPESSTFQKWMRQSNDATRSRLNDLSSTASKKFEQIGSKINKISGYDDIEVLKREVSECERLIAESRQVTNAAKKEYDTAVRRRVQSQKDVNDLLHRKSSWDDKDVSRFTELVREDHTHEQEEARAKEAVKNSEEAVDSSFDALLHAILRRYHEEQVWSDKIRSTSTYGSLAALGVNLLVFILAIIIVEPWKRKRLAQTFEKRIEELSEETRNLLAGGIQEILSQTATSKEKYSRAEAIQALQATDLAETPSDSHTRDMELEETFFRVLDKTMDEHEEYHQMFEDFAARNPFVTPAMCGLIGAAIGIAIRSALW